MGTKKTITTMLFFFLGIVMLQAQTITSLGVINTSGVTANLTTAAGNNTSSGNFYSGRTGNDVYFSFTTDEEMTLVAILNRQTIGTTTSLYLLDSNNLLITSTNGTRLEKNNLPIGNYTLILDADSGNTGAFDLVFRPIISRFNASPIIGNSLPHSVSFTNTSVCTKRYSVWNFGDGSTSTNQNPSHTYTNYGEYTVRLKVQDSIIGTSHFVNKVAYIKISAPVADIGGPASGYFGCAPLSANFVDASIANGAPIVSWLWDFGDGTTSTDQNPSHTYNTPGNYSVSLTVTDSFGNTDTGVFTNAAQAVGPNTNFQANQTLLQSNTSVTFTDLTTFGAPITSWSWNFGDSSSSNLQNPSHTYTTSGDYTVSLTVSDLDGCSRTLTKTAYIKVLTCPANVTINNDLGQCNANVTLPDFEGSTNGNAINLDGTNDYIAAPLPTLFNNISTNDFTVEMWANRTASSSAPSRLFFSQLDTANFVSSLVNSSGIFYVFVKENGNIHSVNTSYSLPLNQWTHLAFKWNATSKSITVLINGVLQTNVSGGSSSVGNDGSMTIGSRTDGAQVFKGKIDEVRIWNQERSDAAIVANMNTCVAETDPNLVAYYHLDEATGSTTASDATGNGYNGSLVNCDTASVWTAGIISCGLYVTNDITNTNNASGIYSLGNTTVTWTATDSAGNTTTCTQIVTVVDNENPVISCPSAITINTDIGQCTSTASIGTPTATDNCGTPTVTNDAPTAFPTGDTTVTWTATDSAGNTAICTQIVTVVDAENPVITCPTAITINTDLGQCTSTASIGTATATDNCGTPIITNDAPTSFPIGDTTVTWTATDSAGNTTTCTQIVTVVDNENPVISCPSTITINTDLGQCTSTASIGTATATDNCGTPIITNDAPTSFPIGDTTVTWTATDSAGNTITCTQIVTVVDNENPVISCPSTITINTDLGQCTSTASIGTATATDNCGTPIITNDAPTSFPIGDTTVTWTATDSAGNTITCTQIVTVVDNENPIAIAQNITISLNGSGNAIITPAMIDNGSSDNCTISSLTLDISTFDCSNVGTPVTVTLTAIDGVGNTNNTTAIVTVEDNSNPVVITQDITVALDDYGSATITPEMINNGSYDNCGILSYSLDINTFNCPRLDEYQIVSLIVTDINGNISTANAEITFSGFDLDLDFIADPCDPEQNPDVTPILGISPNNDGQNDTWTIENITNFPKAKIEVFDRNGVEVFNTINYQNDWRGNRNGTGEIVPVVSYFYSIDIFGDSSLYLKGWLYINY
jgi:gliding motility-associated-like protein